MKNETHDCPICAEKSRIGNAIRNRFAMIVRKRRAMKTVVLFHIVFILMGGLIATYNDTGARYTSRFCYIDGIKCEAGEHRFGGVVIETLKDYLCQKIKSETQNPKSKIL